MVRFISLCFGFIACKANGFAGWGFLPTEWHEDVWGRPIFNSGRPMADMMKTKEYKDLAGILNIPLRHVSKIKWY